VTDAQQRPLDAERARLRAAGSEHEVSQILIARAAAPLPQSPQSMKSATVQNLKSKSENLLKWQGRLEIVTAIANVTALAVVAASLIGWLRGLSWNFPGDDVMGVLVVCWPRRPSAPQGPQSGARNS
jgi:hypothetical protein